MKHFPFFRRKFLRVSTGAIAAQVAAPLGLRSRTAEGLPSSDSPVVVGAGTKQGDEGVVYHRDIHRSDMMQGFPPPTDRRVTSHNCSNSTDILRRTHLNGSFVFKTIPIEKGDGPVWVLPRRMLDPEQLDRAQVLCGKTKADAKRMSVADWLRRSDTDALLVVQDGHIVA